MDNMNINRNLLAVVLLNASVRYTRRGSKGILIFIRCVRRLKVTLTNALLNIQRTVFNRSSKLHVINNTGPGRTGKEVVELCAGGTFATIVPSINVLLAALERSLNKGKGARNIDCINRTPRRLEWANRKDRLVSCTPFAYTVLNTNC